MTSIQTRNSIRSSIALPAIEQGGPRVTKRRFSAWHLLGIPLICVFATGCYTCQSIVQPYEYACCQQMHLTKARLMANKVWHDKYAACYANRDCAHDMRRGFVDGFVDVANGGNGCPPVVPNSHYCVGKCRPIDNCCEVGAWYDGYPLGAAAAEQCGCHRWFKLHLPPHIAARAHPVGCPCAACVDPACQTHPEGCGCSKCGGMIEGDQPALPVPPAAVPMGPVLHEHATGSGKLHGTTATFEADIPVSQPANQPATEQMIQPTIQPTKANITVPQPPAASRSPAPVVVPGQCWNQN